MSLEQTYGKIHIIYKYIYIYIYVSNQIQQNNMQHAFFWSPIPYPVLNSSSLFLLHTICLFCSRAQFRRPAFLLVQIAYCGRLGPGRGKNRAIKRFRNRASSNHDFISISINRTALDVTTMTMISIQCPGKPFCSCNVVCFQVHIWCN